jgi:hypothetical protein
MFRDRRAADRRALEPSGRSEPERRGTSSERRRWTCGILYRTALPVTEIETWLYANATGKWAVALDGIDEGLGVKVLKLMFESQDDKQSFMAAFGGR